MKFFSCKTCGKRISKFDLQAVEARDKKMKGAFCAEGVLTLNFDALPEEQARKLLAEAKQRETEAAGKTSVAIPAAPVAAASARPGRPRPPA